MSEPSFGSDDAYWSSLPAHLRNFIRNALPLAGNLAVQGNGSGVLPGGVTGAGGQRSMYAMAQNIVSTAGGALRSSGGSAMPLSTLPPCESTMTFAIEDPYSNHANVYLT